MDKILVEIDSSLGKPYHFPVLFDIHGNVYLDGRKEKDNFLIKLGISKENKLEIDIGFKVEKSKKEKTQKLTSITKINSLSAKLKKEEVEKAKEMIKEEFDEEPQEDYFPEDSHYHIEQSEEDEEEWYRFLDDDQYFSFSSVTHKINVVKIQDEDIDALYETIIYDKGNVVAKSIIKNSVTPFRVFLHSEGKITVKTTGTSEYNFRLQINDMGDVEIKEI